MAQVTPPDTVTTNTPALIVVVVLVIGLLIVVSLFRFFARMSRPLEMVLMLFESMGEFFGGRRMLLIGCGVIGLIVFGCVVASALAVIAVGTCGTAHPVQLCHWFGR